MMLFSSCLVLSPSQCRQRPDYMKSAMPVHLHGKLQLPILVQSNKALSTSHCVNVILDPELSQKNICRKVPFGVDRNAVFLVDMTCLGNPRDILCDDMGTWSWKGSYRRWLTVDEDGDVHITGKEKPATSTSDLYHVWKCYYSSKSSPDVHKIVVVLQGMLLLK